MTFVLNNKIVCVGKWSIEKQNTRTNRRLHCDKDECILYTIMPSGDYKKLANSLMLQIFDLVDEKCSYYNEIKASVENEH